MLEPCAKKDVLVQINLTAESDLHARKACLGFIAQGLLGSVESIADFAVEIVEISDSSTS